MQGVREAGRATQPYGPSGLAWWLPRLMPVPPWTSLWMSTYCRICPHLPTLTLSTPCPHLHTLTMIGQMCMRMMSAGRSPSDSPPADEAVCRRLSGGTEVRRTEAPGKVASQVLKLRASPGGPSRRWPAASPLGPAWLLTGSRPSRRWPAACPLGPAWLPSRPVMAGGSPGGREAVAPDAVVGCNWGFPTELPAAGNMARMSATGEGAKRLRTGPRRGAEDAATAAGAGRAGVTGAG